MASSIFAFKCSKCDELHEGSPSFGFAAPVPYTWLSEQEREEWAELTDDLCVIARPEGKQYFVRAILEVPIHGVEEPFLILIPVFSLCQQSPRSRRRRLVRNR